MADESKTVTEQLTQLMQNGTEAEVRQFILDHMQEFPPEAQQEFAVGFFEDALDERIEVTEQLAKDKTDVANAIAALENESQEAA